DGGLIGGQGSLVSAGLIGNTAIRPEVMNELEFGFDASFLKSRLAFEFTRYQRKITDLLLTFPLAPSSGLGNQIINGGQLSVLGNEAVVSLIPIRKGKFEWASRIIYNANVQYTNDIPVPAFPVPGSFGAAYGRNRITANTRSTYIWSNAPLRLNPTTGARTVADTITYDSNPIHITTFNNDFTFGRFTVSALLDWRAGGAVSNMTNNLWDEGGNSRDFDAPAPARIIEATANQPGSADCGTRTLGACRAFTFNGGDTRPYMQNGSYVKLREISLNYDAPESWAKKVPGARSLRFNVSGRNLMMWTDYWGFDPEFNNFGNVNFNRFIDLAPFPPSRQFFLSVDLGF
ncbi:MAG: hypothetical protein ACK55A_04660, partial [Gemmatimonas sp.]